MSVGPKQAIVLKKQGHPDSHVTCLPAGEGDTCSWKIPFKIPRLHERGASVADARGGSEQVWYSPHGLHHGLPSPQLVGGAPGLGGPPVRGPQMR